MKKFRVLIIMSLLVLFSLLTAGSTYADGHHHSRGQVVVANRADGTISVIDVRTNEATTVALPEGEEMPEPMYVVSSAAGDRVFVGDRGNDRVVVFDAYDYSVEATVPAGDGVFHMWADARDRQLWVNNDVDNTSTVINPRTLEVMATVPIPADLAADGGKPHDVILDPTGRYAYVSVLGLSGDFDYVVQYSTQTFMEINRAAVGKDPHLSLARQNNLLFVPCQGSDVVIVFDRRTLTELNRIDVPGAHGAFMSPNGKVFYTSNLPGGGTDGLFAINTRSQTVIGEAVDTPYEVPHNIVVTANSRRLFLTHSGETSDKVTVYSITKSDPVPVLIGEVTVGFNPFGLAFVP